MQKIKKNNAKNYKKNEKMYIFLKKNDYTRKNVYSFISII